MQRDLVLPMYEKLPRVTAKPVVDQKLEYTTLGNEVVPGIKDRPQILEHMINRRNLAIDVMQGFDHAAPAALNHHSIYHLYEYECKTRFLDNLLPIGGGFSLYNEMPTRFLLCRYVICLIDDAMRHGKPFELMAMRLNGDIYIGANKTTEQFVDESTKMSAYGGLNFPRMVTTADSPVSFEHHQSVVKKLSLECRESMTSMTIFVSSVARAFDKTGEVVEVKTCGINVLGKLQNLPAFKARNWWLRALLSGANRIVYGLRRSDRRVHEVQEASLSDLTHGHFHFSGNELFSFIFNLFNKVDLMIPQNGEMCLIRSNRFEKVTISRTTAESLKRSPFW